MKISFTGDICFSGIYREKFKKGEFIINPVLKNIFKESDYTVVNLEGPATDRNVIYNSALDVRSPLKVIEFLRSYYINIFNLANNHTFDAGLEGYRDCVKEIKENDSLFFGAGENITVAVKPLIIKKDEVTVALIAVGDSGSSLKTASENECGVFSDMYISEIRAQIFSIREKVDWVVLNFHNGPEFVSYPSSYIVNKLRRYIDMGVDIVIGHHPHIPQGIEKYKNGVIFYSLGNFIFDLKSHRQKKYTNRSIVPTVIFSKENYHYSYITTVANLSDAMHTVLEDNNEVEKINRSMSGYWFKLYRVVDFLRDIFLNPFWFNKKIINLFIPVLILYRLKGYTKGNARAILEDVLDLFYLKRIMKLIPGKDYLNKKNEF